MLWLAITAAVAFAAVAAFLALQLRASAQSVAELRQKYARISDVEAERERILKEVGKQETRIAEIRNEGSTLEQRIAALREEFSVLDEESHLRDFGFYKPRYAFADSARYETELDQLRERQKAMLKDKRAAFCEIEWTVNGSAAEGRKQITQTLRLILRAFNGESDAAIAKVKYNNIQVMEARVRKAYEAINRLVDVQRCRIAPEYLDLKLSELFLVHEYQEQIQREKEEQRRIKEQMREEELAQRELERARVEAEKDEAKYQAALERARREVEQAAGAAQAKLLEQMAELERRLQEAHDNKERAIARAQLTRSGHVYVISNIGSFGEHIYKIGMTRRLDPFERIRELGDASVPFEFDVHAVIFSEDAPKLENTLHHEFEDRRINLVNERKEFFGVTIDEIAAVVRRHHADMSITLLAEAEQYYKTLALRRERQLSLPPGHRHLQAPAAAAALAATAGVETAQLPPN